MTIILNNSPYTITTGVSETAPLTLPQGTQRLVVTYECAAWPVVSDGLIATTLRISDNGGSNYRDEWRDTFQHAQLKHGGVVQSTARFGIGLNAPFGNNSRLKVGFNSAVPSSVSTTVTVEAI